MNKQTYSSDELCAYANTLSSARVLVYGDVMLDRYLHGDAFRISPEAPVPVVHVESERQMMGGAGNVARNIHCLGGQVTLYSVCGDDSPADILDEMFFKLHIDAHLARVSGRKTTTKNRIIARHQQVLRYDQEDVQPLAIAVQHQLLQGLFDILPNYDVMVLSDYGKGLINRAFLESLQARIVSEGLSTRLVVDPKTPNYPLYQGAYLLTPNAKETSEATGLPTSTPEEVKAAGLKLKQNLGLKNLLTTLGAHGMALFDESGATWHIPTVAKEVFDVTGAGDTVIAVVSLCLAAGIPLLPACIIANYAAGMVVAEVGAAAVNLEELKEALSEHSSNLVATW